MKGGSSQNGRSMPVQVKLITKEVGGVSSERPVVAVSVDDIRW